MSADLGPTISAATAYGDDRARDAAAPLQATIDRLLAEAASSSVERTGLLAQIAELQARLDALEGPPTIYGSSGGPTTTTLAATISMLAPGMVRTYSSFQRDICPRDLPQCYSEHLDETKLAAKDPATVQAAAGLFSALPDIDGHWASLNHERNKLGGDPAVHQAAWSVFLELIGTVNATRTHQLRTIAITTGFQDPAAVEPWYVAGADAWGCDPYSTPAVEAAVAYAKAKGKPWGICEYGFSTTGEPITDNRAMGRLATDVPLWEAATPRPVFVCYWNAKGNTLTLGGTNPRPNTAAYWRALNGPR